MRLLILLVVVVLGVYGCCRYVTSDDTESPVSTYKSYDNFVDRASADGADCIRLNSNMVYSDGNYYNNGTYDLVDGKPVCGVRADITTQDGKHYSAWFNRFKTDDIRSTAEYATHGGKVYCTDAERTECYVTGKKWSSGQYRVHKLD